MNKNGTKGTKYAIQWESHPKNLLKSFCSLMEHQSLVDVVICCGNNTIQAHKFLLAANSPLFKDEFEKNLSIEQIIISGCEFAVLKNLVEIMYCGQSVVKEENMKYLIALIKLFQMKHLEILFADHCNNAEEIILPKPEFLTKKPKYSAFTFQMPNSKRQTSSAIPSSTSPSASANTTPEVVTHTPIQNNEAKPINFSVNYPDPLPGLKHYGKGKQTLQQTAEQACVKEAQASRMALASLQKEIAATPQVNSFIIEDTCSETTVENFIPHTDKPEYFQVLNFNDVIAQAPIENSIFLPVANTAANLTEPGPYSADLTPNKHPLMAEKLKHILGGDMMSNVEIMYKDADGNFVPVNEEVLQNLSTKEGLQYQVVDEDGHVSEMQELHVIDNEMAIDKIIDTRVSTEDGVIPATTPVVEVSDYLKQTEATLSDGFCSIVHKDGDEAAIATPIGITVPTIELHTVEVNQSKTSSEIDLKFSPDIFFADMMHTDVPSDATKAN